jgi:hypothetical protein
VNSLQAKLLLAMFPANAPFFKLTIDQQAQARMGISPDKKAELDKALSGVEQVVVDDIETSMTRQPAGEAIKHLLVAGNTLVFMKPEGGLKVFPLHQYVVKRGPEGTLLEAIVEEHLSPMEIDDVQLRDSVVSRIKAENKGGKATAENTICLYTSVNRQLDGSYKVRQELHDVPLLASAGSYPAGSCPWLALMWSAVCGEDYGRGLVEDYIGDFISVEGLQAAIVKAAAIAARIVTVVSPNGTTKKMDLTKAETGGVISGTVTDGRAVDVAMLQADKSHDLAVAQSTRDAIKTDLSYAFMLNTAIQRDAERVTAEEIRFMANELDSTLSGSYSNLSLTFQRPFLTVRMLQLSKMGKLSALPPSIKPVIVTGIAALGRGAELANLQALVKDIVDLGGPEALNKYMNFGNLITQLATARQVKTDGLVKTDDQIAQAEAQEQQQQAMSTLGPNAVNAAGGIAKQVVANHGSAPQAPAAPQ